MIYGQAVDGTLQKFVKKNKKKTACLETKVHLPPPPAWLDCVCADCKKKEDFQEIMNELSSATSTARIHSSIHKLTTIFILLFNLKHTFSVACLFACITRQRMEVPLVSEKTKKTHIQKNFA